MVDSGRPYNHAQQRSALRKTSQTLCFKLLSTLPSSVDAFRSRYPEGRRIYTLRVVDQVQWSLEESSQRTHCGG